MLNTPINGIVSNFINDATYEAMDWATRAVIESGVCQATYDAMHESQDQIITSVTHEAMAWALRQIMVHP